MKSTVYTLLFLLVCCKVVNAQDPTFSQFYFNNLYVNPAYAGISQGLRVTADYRNLWGKVPGAFPTFHFSTDAQNVSISSGIGLNAFSDTEGEGHLRTQSIGGFYSYRVMLVPRNWMLQAGFQTSIVSKSINWSHLLFSDQLDNVRGIIGPTATVPPNQDHVSFADFSTGFLIRGNQRNRTKDLLATYTFGFSVHHLVQPNESIIGLEARLPRKYVAHAGAVIPVRVEVSKTKILLAPNLLWEQQGNMTTFITSFNVLVSPIYAGLSYRNQTPAITNFEKADAIIINAGLNGDWGKGAFVYKLGYSYDLTISDLRSATNGSHEIVLVMEFRNFSFGRHSNPKKRMECPEF